MKPNLLLTISAVYLALVGIGFLFAPDVMLFSTLPANTPAAVVAALRGLGGTLIAIAVLNGMARNADASKARDAIFLGNTLGFALAVITMALGLLSGAPAMGWVIVVVNALFAIAFFLVGKGSMSS